MVSDLFSLPIVACNTKNITAAVTYPEQIPYPVEPLNLTNRNTTELNVVLFYCDLILTISSQHMAVINARHLRIQT
ncbi:hypothetical protein evm_010356 [Chilo suppressalis]|nr:hypothetical protein evm_010356 [Chilo suppressalis]